MVINDFLELPRDNRISLKWGVIFTFLHIKLIANLHAANSFVCEGFILPFYYFLLGELSSGLGHTLVALLLTGEIMCALRLYKFRGSTNVSSSVPQRINSWLFRPHTRLWIPCPKTRLSSEEEIMTNVGKKSPSRHAGRPHSNGEQELLSWPLHSDNDSGIEPLTHQCGKCNLGLQCHHRWSWISHNGNENVVWKIATGITMVTRTW